jgi:hypothetical protein
MDAERDQVRPLLIGIAVFGLLHHADHVLRADHSGWPFQAEVTPFTFSLLIYPMLLADYVVRRKPWIRVGLLSAGLSFLLLVHTTVETPADLYYTWSSGASTTEANPGIPNLLEVASPTIGLLSNVVLLSLCATLIATLFFAVRQARTRLGEASRLEISEVV